MPSHVTPAKQERPLIAAPKIEARFELHDPLVTIATHCSLLITKMIKYQLSSFAFRTVLDKSEAITSGCLQNHDHRLENQDSV